KRPYSKSHLTFPRWGGHSCLPRFYERGMCHPAEQTRRIPVRISSSRCHMHDPIRESDWKVLRDIQPLALDRLCQCILDEITAIATTPIRPPCEIWQDLW